MADLPKTTNLARTQALLRTVAEELKLPLMQIVREAELTHMIGQPLSDSLKSIQLSANSAIELVDSYMLGLEMAEQQQMLALEPVAIGSVLYDVSRKLSSLAKRYEVQIKIETLACEPVMANQAALGAAIYSMGAAFVESMPGGNKDERVLTLAAHRSAGSLVAGIYSPFASISSEQLRRAGQGQTFMRQPLKHFSSTTSAGIFIAKAILESMSARLRTAHYRKQSGLAAILQPSHQLELI